MSINNRLDRLEKAYGPEQRTVIFSTMQPGEEPPGWARALVDEHVSSRPWLGGVELVEWSKQMNADVYQVSVGGEYYEVTPDGLTPTAEPIRFTFRLDDPNGVGQEEER